MSSSCAQWRGDIGAYIVGALNGRARVQVTRHLAACAGCRADYDELVPVRDWLDLLDLMTGAPQPAPARRRGAALAATAARARAVSSDKGVTGADAPRAGRTHTRRAGAEQPRHRPAACVERAHGGTGTWPTSSARST